MKFENYHPAINLIFFTSLIVCTLCFRHPVYLGISYEASFIYSVWLNGKKALVFNVCLIPLCAIYAWWYGFYHHFGVTIIRQNFVGNNITLESYVYGAVLALSIATVFFFLTLFLPETVLGIFTSDPEVLAVGSRYLILVSGGTLIENFIYLACGIVIGSGNTQISLLGSLMANVLFRVGGAFFLYYGTSLGFEGMGLVSLLSPIAALLVNGIFLITGKWKRSR